MYVRRNAESFNHCVSSEAHLVFFVIVCILTFDHVQEKYLEDVIINWRNFSIKHFFQKLKKTPKKQR